MSEDEHQLSSLLRHLNQYFTDHLASKITQGNKSCLNSNQEDHITRQLPSSKSELTIKTCPQSELLKQLCKYFVTQHYLLPSIEPSPIFDYSHIYHKTLLASQIYIVCTRKVKCTPRHH